MKTGLFIFEKKIYKDPEGHYYDTVFTDSVLERYKSVVDRLFILARVTLLTQSRDEILKKYSQITLDKVNIVEIDNVLSARGILNYSKVKKIVDKIAEKSDVFFIRVPSVWQSELVKFAKKNNKRYILEVGADAWATYWNAGIGGKLFAPYIEFSTKNIIKDSQYTVYVTNEWLQNRYPTKGKWIACSNVDINVNDEHILKKRIDKIMNHDGKIKIGTLANVASKSKGQKYVIQALGKLKRKGIDNFEYHLAGSGNKEILSAVAKEEGVLDQVYFDGLIRHDKIANWFESIDIYVQPSRQEGLPRSLIEAISYAVPSFGAQTGGIPELLNPKYVFSNKKTNIDEICEILEKYTPEEMIIEAERGFIESKQYNSEIIEERRHHFFLGIVKG